MGLISKIAKLHHIYFVNLDKGLSMLIRYLIMLLLFNIVFIKGALASTDMQPSVFEDSKELVPAGTEFYYYVKLQNNTGIATNDTVKLYITIPKGFKFEGDNGGHGCVYDGAGANPSNGNLNDRVVCTFPTFAGNNYEEINITVLSGEELGVFKSVASVEYSGDTNNANDLENTKTTIVESADVELVSINPPPGTPVVSGDNVTFTVNIANNGPFATQDVKYTMTVPVGLSYTSFSGGTGGWSCSESGGDLTCSRPDNFAKDANETFDLNFKVTAQGGSTIPFPGVASSIDTIIDRDRTNNDQSTSITTLIGTDLSMSKSTNSSTIIEGEVVVFTLNIKNQGVHDATDVVVTDTMPPDHTFTESNISAPADWNCSVAGLTIECRYDGNLSAGYDDNIVIHAMAPNVTEDKDYTNSATLATTLTDPIAGNNSGSTTYTVRVDQIDLELVSKDKKHKVQPRDNEPIIVGNIMESIIKVKNNGPRDAGVGEVFIVDVLDENESYVTFSGTNWNCVESGGNVTCTYDTMLANGASTSALTIETKGTQADDNVSNRVDVNHTNPDYPDLNGSNNNKSADMNVSDYPSSANLEVTKTTSNGDVNLSETSFAYTIKIKNHGPAKAKNVEFSDTIPQYIDDHGGRGKTELNVSSSYPSECGDTQISGGSVTCTFSEIDANETVEVNITVSGAMVEGLLVNKASAYSKDTADSNRSNNEGNVSVNVAEKVDIELTQSFEYQGKPDPMWAGTDAILRLSVENHGPAEAKDVNITNVFVGANYRIIDVDSQCSSDDNITFRCNVGDIPYGSTKGVTITLRPKHLTNPPTPWDINNSAQTQTTSFETNTTNNFSNGRLLIQKGQVDLSIDKNEAENFFEPIPYDFNNAANNIIVYKITVSNFGPSEATGINIIDRVVSVNPDDDQNITFLGDTNQSDGSDYNMSNYSSNHWCKEPSPVTFKPRNRPDINCSLPNMEKDTTVARYLVFHVDKAPHKIKGDVYHNEVNVTSDENETLYDNNFEDERTTVRTMIDLDISKTASKKVVEIGEDFNFTFDIANHGPGYAQNAVLKDTLPKYLKVTGSPTYTSAGSLSGDDDMNGTCSVTVDNSTEITSLECNLNDKNGTVKNGRSRQVILPVRYERYPDGNFTVTNEDNGTIFNRATVRSNDDGSDKWKRLERNVTNNEDNESIVILKPIHIGNFVWHDTDADGVQDGGESGIEGVRVKLYEVGNPTPIMTTETNSTGEYGFDLNSSGNYYIEFDDSLVTGTPDGVNGFDKVSPQYQGGDRGRDSNIYESNKTTETFFVNYGDNNLTLDAGFYDLAELGNRIWEDTNGNGKQDSGENNTTESITVNLYKYGNTTLQQSVSTTNGSYTFVDLIPGDYYVEFVIPNDHNFTLRKYTGTNNTNDSDANSTGQTQTTTLTSGEIDLRLDAGIYREGVNLGDRVWLDYDGDGIQDDNANEKGVEGVTVIATNTFTGQTHTTDTNSSGGYLFKDLIPGPYIVTFDINSTYRITPRDQGSDDSNDSDPKPSDHNTTTINLVSGEDNLTIDAGLYQPVKIGDQLWYDENANGKKDDANNTYVDDEKGTSYSGNGVNDLAGVTVTLIIDGVLSSKTTTTNSSGFYLFDDLLPGHSYGVKFNQPVSNLYNGNFKYRFTTPNSDSDHNDSDANTTGYTASTPVMYSGDENLTLDAGVYMPVEISDYVWEDLNYDGIQNDGNQTGQNGFIVQLIVDGVVQTDINTTTYTTSYDNLPGKYYFGRSLDLKPNHTYGVKIVLKPGWYISKQDQGNSDYLDSDINETTGETKSITMYANDINYTFDMGVYRKASLGNRVWLDANGNGIQDSGESNVSDINVTLYDENNNSVRSMLTDSNGSYLFADLDPGYYFVEFNLSSNPSYNGYRFTEANVTGSRDDNNSDANVTTGRTQRIFLQSGENNVSLDAGIYKPVSIGDYTWEDDNGDGIQDSGESELSNVPVELWRYNSISGNAEQVTVDLNGSALMTETNATGGYLFANLKPDTYFVKFTAPLIGGEQSVITLQNVGSDLNNSDTNVTGKTSGRTGDYTLPTGTDERDVDAGFYVPVSVGDRVWIDKDYDGIQDSGEENLSGVTVTLYDESNNPVTHDVYGNAIGGGTGTITTTSTGYLFEDLPAGHSYYVKFDIADYNTTNGTSYRFTQEDVGGDRAIDSDANTVTTQSDTTGLMTSGQKDLTLDAGVYEPVIIGDKVWHDVNANGIQDSGEDGVAGVKVQLFISGTLYPDINTTTDANGEYLFDDSFDLKPNETYSVKFIKPDGSEFVFTYPNAVDSNDTNDSDANRTTGEATNSTGKMYSSDENLSLDAGLFIPANLGNRIWYDNDGDGFQDADELGVADVNITLYDANGTRITHDHNGTVLGNTAVAGVFETNSSGEYYFHNLRPGRYYVEFNASTIPSGFVFTEANASSDSNDTLDSDVNATGFSFVITLESNETNHSIDAGIYKPASIGDYTWIDENGDGVAQSDEANLSDVNITLWYTEDNGTKTQVTQDVYGNAFKNSNGAGGIVTTDVNGSYLFDNLRPRPNYYLKFKAPTNGSGEQYVITLQDSNLSGGVDSNDSDINGTGLTFGTTTTYQLLSGEYDDSVDAGFYIPVKVGDRVWIDRNFNGIQDANEQNLSGVKVYLYDSNGSWLKSDVNGTTFGGGAGYLETNSSGEYLFSNLAAGRSYFVEFNLSDYNTSHSTNFRFTQKDTTGDESDSDANCTTQRSDVTPLMRSGEDNLTLDAGVYQPVTIGDLVWHDKNGNGIQDNGEDGIEKIKVVLIIDGVEQNGIDSDKNYTIETNATGGYLFDGSYDLKPDSNYSVRFIKPLDSPYVFTLQDVNTTNDLNDSDANLSGMSLTATPKMDSNESNLTLDAGMYIPAELGDRVWVDQNGNGLQDSGEANVSNVIVRLYDKNDNPVTTNLYGETFGGGAGYLETNNSGEYLFTNLKPDSYYVKFELPTTRAGYRFTEQNISGSAADNNSDANITTYKTPLTVLDSNESDRTWDAGIYKPVSLGDYAWIDKNGNGKQDSGEAYLEGVKVSLFRSSDDSQVTKDLNGTTFDQETNATGGYLFGNLKPDSYYVVFESPTGSEYVLTLNNALSGDDDNDSDTNVTAAQIGKSHTVTLDSGEHDYTIDAGFYIPAALGNYIWIDENGNGLQDVGEANVAEANVTLWYEDNNTQVFYDIDGNDVGSGGSLGVYTTGADGLYLFDRLRPDNYRIEVAKPNATYIFTTQNVNGDANNSMDSDIDTATGHSDAISLESNETNLSLDAGLVAPVTIGDRVWLDLDADGIQDSNEDNYTASVINVRLYNADTNTSVDTTTVTNGKYEFTNVFPANYYIKFDLPATYFVSPKNAGSDDTSDSDTNASGYIASFKVTSGDDNLTLDMGLYQKTSLGDRVWYDDNGNGMQDGGESNVTDYNITVNLYKVGTIGIFDTQTTHNGAYLFDELDPASYHVEFVPSTLPPKFVFTETNVTNGSESNNSDANVTTGQTHILTLTSGEDNRTLDAGIFEPVSIGDYTWVDADGNGIQNSGELALANVKVTLWRNGVQVTQDYNASQSFVGKVTDSNGSYLFDNLRPGDYAVRFEAPTGYVLTLNNVVTTAEDSDSDTNVTATTIGQSQPYTLTSREHNRSVDAGFYRPVFALGDRVWLDRNGNGIQDVNESGVADANVTLWRYVGGVAQQVTTNIDGTPLGNQGATGIYKTASDGNYSFARIKPDTYFIKVVAPNPRYEFTKHNANSDSNDSKDSDMDIATGRSDDLVLDSNEENLTLDAGLYLPVAIGDRVWIDLNANGIQESGEGNYTGSDINATLYYEANNSVASSVVVTNGAYQFTNVLPERYYIKFNLPTNYYVSPKDNAGDDQNDSDANATGYIAPFSVYSGMDDLSLDMGIFQKASIGDRIWYDYNMDGIQDANESNVNVPVRVKLIYDKNGSVAMEQNITNGSYLFVNVIPNNYVVEFTLPDNYALSPRSQGGSEVTDSDVNGTTMRSDVIAILNSGDININVDMGIYELASIGDRVWIDSNANSIQDAGEPNYSGSVTVTLYDGGGAVVATQNTSGGTYQFTKLTPATYSVGFTLPSGYILTAKGSGSASDSDAQSGTLRTTPTLLEPGEDDLSWDMGLYQNGSLGDRIWHDINANGIQDVGEANFDETITVALYSGSSKIKEMQTSNGVYSFSGLKPGSYSVRFIVPQGYTLSPQYQGDDAKSDSNAGSITGATESVFIASGQGNTTLDAGLYKKASLGNRIWFDNNANGIQDDNEKDANESITVTLYDKDGQVLATQETHNGNYLFDALVPSEYYVSFSLPQGYSLSPSNRGNDSDKDSDVNSTFKTKIEVLVSGEQNLSLDMGIYQSVSLGDRIWIDSNANGIQDMNESNFNDEVNVTLYDANGSKVQTISTSNGHYLFEKLVPSDYYVEFSLPDGYTPSPKDSGSDGEDSDLNATTMRSDVISLSPNEKNLSVDLGLFKKVNLGDRVWYDRNQNGLQDGGEEGVENIKVTLLDNQGNELESTTTNGDGNYLFSDLTPATYSIVFSEIAQGYLFTLPNQEGNDSIDSDANGQGVVENITLISGEDNVSIDAGIHPEIVASDDYESGEYQESTTVSIHSNDSDNLVPQKTELTTQGLPEGSRVSEDGKKVTVPGEGRWEIDDRGNITFTPNANFFNDPTPLEYQIEDSDGNIATAKVYIDYPPVANDDVVERECSENSYIADVLANDVTDEKFDLTTLKIIDPNGNAVDMYENPNEGIWFVQDGEILFDALSGYGGKITPISYTIKEEDGDSVSGTAKIYISYPEVRDDIVIASDTARAGIDPIVVDIFANDPIINPNLDTLQITGTQNPGESLVVKGEGVWSIEGDKIIYTPQSGFLGDPAPIEYSLQTQQCGDVMASFAKVSVFYPLLTRDDNASTTPGKAVSLDIHHNDNGNIDVSKTQLGIPNDFPIPNTTISTDKKKVSVPGEGVWELDENGMVTFTPEKECKESPTPIIYTAFTPDGSKTSTSAISVEMEDDCDCGQIDSASAYNLYILLLTLVSTLIIVGLAGRREEQKSL